MTDESSIADLQRRVMDLEKAVLRLVTHLNPKQFEAVRLQPEPGAWTKELPTKKGFWWLVREQSPEGTTQVVLIFPFTTGDLYVIRLGRDEQVKLTEDNFAGWLWQGPITPNP